MGMEVEFNWYIVLSDKNITSAIDHDDLDAGLIRNNRKYKFTKGGYRIYPLDTPLPLIYNGKCMAMAVISEMRVNETGTHITVEPIIVLNESDSVAMYYEESFRGYKSEQQKINDGGKFDIRSVVNPEKRVRV